MPSWDRLLADAGLHLAYLSGVTRLSERRTGGAGVILKFERVKPRRSGAFQPLRSREITPEFLNKAINKLKRWNFDFVSIGDAATRASEARAGRRFVCLTFDGGYSDFNTFAYPVLSHHGVPFTVYVPTGFIDGIGQVWWIALEQIIAGHARIGLAINDTDRYFGAATPDEKQQLYDLLYGWMRGLSPTDRAVAIDDLCRRYGVDLKSVSREVVMTWSNLTTLARDPQATIGSATVNYPSLASVQRAVALREMTMGKSVLENALGIDCRHFAYPFGDSDSFGSREISLAQDAGFVTAVSTVPGVVRADARSNLLSLPRIPWDGRRTSLNALRAILSGVTFRSERTRGPEASYS